MTNSVAQQNRQAWNRAAREESDSSIPVGPEEIDEARRGNWSVKLTPKKPVPRDWFPDLARAKVLCLGASGGQQVPILAAAGAEVTVVDVSELQLEKDRIVGDENDLSFECIQGDMTELDRFESQTFDMVFNPTSSLFLPDVLPLWEGCRRVLKSAGMLLAGSMNPSFFLFDHEEARERGCLEVKFPLPYSDLTSLTEAQRQATRAQRETVEFGHTLEDLIGGQIRCGFEISGFYEDSWYDSATLLNVFSATSFATKSVKR